MAQAVFGIEDATVLLIAPAIGSFIGVVVRRLPEGRPLAWSRSQCDGCGVELQSRDLVPLVSWALLRGRCRHCGAPLGWFYPAVELAALGIAAIALAVDGFPYAWAACALGWWLLTLGWIDATCWLLPDLLTLPLIVVGLCEAAFFEPDRLFDRALGAVIGYLALVAVALAYRALRGREGLGLGDAKLLAAGGAWLGAAMLPQVVLLAALTALAAAAAMRLRGANISAATAVPFGPFIALAIWACWLSR